MRLRTLLSPLVAALLCSCDGAPLPPLYQLVVVQRRPITVVVRAPGAIRPADSVPIFSKAAGQITRVLVSPGDTVEAGDLLAQVDDRLARAALAQAVATLAADSVAMANAADRADREEDLFDHQAVTQSEYDSVALGEDVARAQATRSAILVDNARLLLENTAIRAPAGGVVLRVAIAPGSVVPSAISAVGAQHALIDLANLDSVDMIAPIYEQDVGKLTEGLAARVSVDAYPGRVFAGRVSIIEPQAIHLNNETLFPVHTRVANPRHMLRPGMNGDLAVQAGPTREAVAIPVSALRARDDLATAALVLGRPLAVLRNELSASGAGRFAAFVMRQGVPHAVAVTTGASDGEYAPLLSGSVAPGDTVLVLPSTGLLESQERIRRRYQRYRLPVTR